MSALLASICILTLATREANCAEPIPFETARVEVERRVLAQAQFYNPAIDRIYYYLDPVTRGEEEEQARLMRPLSPEQPAPRETTAREDSEPFVSKYNTNKYPGPGKPAAASGKRQGYVATMEPVR